MKAIFYQNGPFFVTPEEFGSGRLKPKSRGFAVYEEGITHSKRVATIGYDGQKGLDLAKTEADKRANQKGTK